MAQPKRKRTIDHAPAVKRFAGRLRELRTTRGLTQAELAHRSQITTSYVWKLESAGAAPGIDLVDRLAVALGTTSHDLLPLADRPDTVEALKGRARELFETLMRVADHDDLILVNPFLAKLVESATSGR